MCFFMESMTLCVPRFLRESVHNVTLYVPRDLRESVLCVLQAEICKMDTVLGGGAGAEKVSFCFWGWWVREGVTGGGGSEKVLQAEICKMETTFGWRCYWVEVQRRWCRF